ncbi:MAG: hypothetical protein HY301_04770 [Verrucomicrobia bacterium]|nr:hypothetical protein [Verrucomicrobiota bacterium]
MKLWLLRALLLGLFISTSLHAADPLDIWTVRNPLPTPNDLRAVTTGNGLVVAVGTAGTIVTSADAGDTWTTQDPGVTNVNVSLVGVAYGNGRFAAVSELGSQHAILTSLNGTNWTTNSGVSSNVTAFTGLAFGGGTFVAVGYGTVTNGVSAASAGSSLPQSQVINTGANQGSIHISYDFYAVPDQMTIFYNGTNIYDTGYISGAGQFDVNYGPGGATNVTIIMNQFTNPVPGSTWQYSVAIGGPGGSAATNIILTSADGVSWTRQAGGLNDALNAVTYAQNQFVAVGGTASPTNRGHLITSPDGITWTTRRTNVPALYAAVAGNANGFAAVGGRLTSRSANCVTWTDATDVGIGLATRNAIAAGTNFFVAADTTRGVSDSSVFDTSTDGAAWTTNGTFESVSAITFANGRFYAVGTANQPGVSPLGTKPALLFSDDGIGWKRRTGGLRNVGGSRAPEFTAAAYANGVFAAFTTNPIGQAPAVFRSTNGADWTGNIYGGGALATGAIFTNGQFVAVGGYAGTDYTSIATSTDASNWTARVTGSVGALSSVAFGNGLYVAVGRRSSGARPVLTSVDGTGWSFQTPGISNDLFGVAFGGGNFVAVGAAGTVARSADGVNWTVQSITASNHLRGVTFANSQFVAVGDWGGIFTSPNGTSWTRRTSGVIQNLNTATFFKGRYVVGGDGGKVLTSTDAIAWSATDSGTDLAIYGTAASANVLLLVGDSILLDTSTNGLDWSVRDLSDPLEALFREVLGVDDRILALGGAQAVSPAGRNWAGNQTGGLLAGNGAVYTNGLVVAVGTDEPGQTTRISTSTDRGDSWTTATLGTLGQLYGIVHGNGLFVAVGDRPGGSNAVILTSTNGFNWTPRNSGTNTTLHDIAYGNGIFVAVGYNGGVKSTDGITWTPAPAAAGGTVAFGGGKFIAADSGILLSTNGTTWVNVLSNSVSLENVRYGLGTFVAAGPSGIYTSTNGSAWQQRFVATRQKLNAVGFANDSAYVVGYSGTIYQSGYLASTPATIVRGPQSQTVISGAAATFTANVTGRLPMNFQWFKNGVPIPGATDAALTFAAATTSDTGSYHVVAANEFGAQASSPATLTVASISVSVNPQVLYLFTGTTGAFTAVVTGGTPTSYQWRLNASFIPGATNAALVFTNAQYSNTLGYYYVTAYFPYGALESTVDAYLALISDLSEINLYYDDAYQSVPVGSNVVIGASVAGPTPLSLQWRKNGALIPGATNRTLVFTNAQVTNSAGYTYLVTYAQGSLTNTSASTLIVYANDPPVFSGGQLLDPTHFQITFTGLTNRYYQIDYTTNLTQPINWQVLDYPLVVTNPVNYPVLLPALPSSKQHFFRLQLLPP